MSVTSNIEKFEKLRGKELTKNQKLIILDYNYLRNIGKLRNNSHPSVVKFNKEQKMGPTLREYMVYELNTKFPNAPTRNVSGGNGGKRKKNKKDNRLGKYKHNGHTHRTKKALNRCCRK